MNNKTYKFPCGCEFIITPVVLPDGRPSIEFEPNIENINLDCVKTWDFISSGNTKGIFQLESQLGQSLARKLKPRNIEHLAALISIMRPGVLQAVRDKKSVTMHYIDRKNNDEEVSYFHPSLEPALKTTYGEMVYQEQAMQIARDIAGFTLQEADELRKAIGKKLPEAMTKVKTKFLEGCKIQNKVTEDEAHQIFDWIEKSQRYSFNKSHAVSYAYNAYLSAHPKAHFTKAFFTSYLRYAKEKAKPFDEVRELIQNSRLMKADVCSPNFTHLYKHFRFFNGKIRFGFCDIKGVGESVWKKIVVAVGDVKKLLKREVKDWSWLDFLVYFAPKVTSTAVEGMINTGAISYMGMTRTEMIYEYNIYTKLSKKEVEWVEKTLIDSKTITLKELLEMILQLPTGREFPCQSEKRKFVVQGLYNTLLHPTYQLKDTPEWLSSIEQSLLGIPMTCTSVEACDISSANCTCIEYLNHNEPKVIIMAAQIDSYHEIKVKNGASAGKKMAFLKISDITGQIDEVVVFADKWEEARKVVFNGNNLLIHGQRSKDGKSMIVQQVWQI